MLIPTCGAFWKSISRNTNAMLKLCGELCFQVLQADHQTVCIRFRTVHEGCGNFTVDVDDSHGGTIVPAHSVKSVNVNFHILALDCARCFDVCWGNPHDLQKSLTMIIACTSAWRGGFETQLMEIFGPVGIQVVLAKSHA